MRHPSPAAQQETGERRVRQLLDRLDKVGVSPGHIRNLRALTLLERIGNAEARRLLKALAAGAPTRLTAKARVSLQRLVGR